MNCLCNIFDDNTVWLIIIALIILFILCNECGGVSTARSSCGCGCNG